MKILKTLLLCGITTTALASCGTVYDIQLVLNRSGSFYSHSEQSVTFEIMEQDAIEHGIKLSDKLDSKMIKINSFLEGKTLSITRDSDTKFTVTATGESKYNFGSKNSVEFMIEFEDSLINKKGFHSLTTSVLSKSGMYYCTTSLRGTDSVYSTIGDLDVQGAKLKNSSLATMSNVESGSLLITENEDKSYTLALTSIVLSEGISLTISFPKECFDINKAIDLVITFTPLYNVHVYF